VLYAFPLVTISVNNSMFIYHLVSYNVAYDDKKVKVSWKFLYLINKLNFLDVNIDFLINNTFNSIPNRFNYIELKI
jgi:hypothetical protein